MIEIKGLRPRYHDGENRIHLVIPDGEILAVTGVRGSGKSSLLSHIAGADGFDISTIEINGRHPGTFSRNEAARLLFHHSSRQHASSSDTVMDFCLLCRSAYHSAWNPPSDFDKQVVDEYLHLFGLEKHSSSPLHTLSDSTRQIVTLAGAFIREPQHLLLDEPSIFLTPGDAGIVSKIIKRYTLTGERTVVIATNDLNFACATADRIAVMKEGIVIEEGAVSMVNADFVTRNFGIEVVISRNLYNGRPEIHPVPDQ